MDSYSATSHGTPYNNKFEEVKNIHESMQVNTGPYRYPAYGTHPSRNFKFTQLITLYRSTRHTLFKKKKCNYIKLDLYTV